MHSHGNAAYAWARHRLAGAALGALVVSLAVAACSAGGSFSADPTTTPIPITPPRGTLYAFGNSPGNSSAPTTDVYAFSLSDGTQTWHGFVSAGVTGAVSSNGPLFIGTGMVGATLPVADAVQALNAGTGAPLWRTAGLIYGVETPLAATSDTVFAETNFPNGSYPSGMLTALRARDGVPLWKVNFAPGSVMYVTPGTGEIYVIAVMPLTTASSGPVQFVLMAMSAKDGKSLWHMAIPGPAVAPVLSDGILYLATQDPVSDNIITSLAVRASDGTVIWSKAPPATGSLVEFIVSGQTVVYSYRSLSAGQSGIVALRGADGSLLWHTVIAGAEPIPLAADANGIYTAEQAFLGGGGLSTVLAVLDRRSGTRLRFYPLPASTILFDPAAMQIRLAQGVAYVVGSNYSASAPSPGAHPALVSAVLAINTQTGHIFWQQQFNGTAFPNILIAS